MKQPVLWAHLKNFLEKKIDKVNKLITFSSLYPFGDFFFQWEVSIMMRGVPDGHNEVEIESSGSRSGRSAESCLKGRCKIEAVCFCSLSSTPFYLGLVIQIYLDQSTVSRQCNQKLIPCNERIVQSENRAQ